MNDVELRKLVLDTLLSIAPETEIAQLAPDQPLRNQVDLDSFDWLNFLLALHQQLHVDIPEADYRRLVSVDTIVIYLQTKLAGQNA